MAVEVKQVKTKKDLSKFIWFGIDLYKNCKFAAPPLYMDDKKNLTKGKNPALDFCDAVYFLAYKGNEVVGRIAVIINPVANGTWNLHQARFGWVDFIDDMEVSKALFDTACEWARNSGMRAIHGPLGFTDFDHEGTLIRGFDQRGTLGAIYNYEYYPKHIEAYGFSKDIDWYEYKVPVPEVFPERFFRIAEIVQKKHKLRVVKCKSRKELVRKYASKMFDLLNECYQDLYGFSKLNEKQKLFYINLYFGIARLDTIAIIVNEQDDVMAVGISLPNVTDALQKAKGKLFPFGWYYLLKALRKSDAIDLYLMGVHPSLQGKGVNSIIFAELMPVYAKNGYKYAESNPELENNTKMSSQWSEFEHECHKTRRVYIKNL